MANEGLHRDRVLIVDDSPDSLGFLLHALEAAGIAVLVATDGESALATLGQCIPDLVLLDAVMPGMDGFETCRRLKRIDSIAHLPVVFMTGLSETEHVIEGLGAGGVDYLTKPIVIDELIARVRIHIANARAAQGSRVALDATGRTLLATDAAGKLLWCTPQAGRLLAAAFPAFDRRFFTLPNAVVEKLPPIRKDAPGGGTSFTIGGEADRLELSFLGEVVAGEYLFRMTERRSANEQELLMSRLGLTPREAEVLNWIACGKSNRDISEILGISPRTVNKHLEQIFPKLGIENRASAAAIAVREIAMLM